MLGLGCLPLWRAGCWLGLRSGRGFAGTGRATEWPRRPGRTGSSLLGGVLPRRARGRRWALPAPAATSASPRGRTAAWPGTQGGSGPGRWGRGTIRGHCVHHGGRQGQKEANPIRAGRCALRRPASRSPAGLGATQARLGLLTRGQPSKPLAGEGRGLAAWSAEALARQLPRDQLPLPGRCQVRLRCQPNGGVRWQRGTCTWPGRHSPSNQQLPLTSTSSSRSWAHPETPASQDPCPPRPPRHHGVSRASRQPCPLPHFMSRVCTREQVRARRSLLSPPRQRPSPGLTGGRDEREQLVQDTCPHPVSWGPTGLPRGTHRAVARATGRVGLRKGAQRSTEVRPRGRPEAHLQDWPFLLPPAARPRQAHGRASGRTRGPRSSAVSLSCETSSHPLLFPQPSAPSLWGRGTVST